MNNLGENSIFTTDNWIIDIEDNDPIVTYMQSPTHLDFWCGGNALKGRKLRLRS